MRTCRVSVIGFGASTPIGRTVWASAAAARAGISGFSEHPYMIDSAGEPMHVARASWLDDAIEGIGRYCALLFPAIDEALAARINREDDLPRVGLTLALPPVRPGCPERLGERLHDVISERYGGVFIDMAIFDCGHAAGYLAFDYGMRHILGGLMDACVVAGVDSYIAPETLEWLDANDQLHGGGALNNAWGFIPGEAAGAVLLGSLGEVRNYRGDVYGEMVSIGIGRETKLIKTDAVCVGEGLTEAFRVAFARLAPEDRIDDVFCDLNGETYRADEYGFTVLRMKSRLRAANDFVAPADCWGDIGAAGAPLHVALGLIAHRKQYAKGRLSLAWGSSESGERGAAICRGLTAARM